MNAPTAPPEPNAPPAPPTPPADLSADDSPRRGIVTGLSAHIADRLGVDPLWIRLAFVVGALFGGLGIVVYAGAWLAIMVARSTATRAIGWSIVVLALVVAIDNEVHLVTGPIAVIALLSGLALALWKPVSAPSDRPAVLRHDDSPRRRTWHPPTAPTARRIRPPSILGRATLGAALVVAAGGALVDELNDGRLHPEQWLGAAAITCGVGLLIGTIIGHARWLIVPAAAFATIGYGSGVMARIGVQPTDAFTSAYVWVSADSTGPYRSSTGFGPTYVSVSSAPATPQVVNVRTGNGMELAWNPDVAVEIRSRLGPVTMRRNGVETTGSTLRIGPSGAADVVIDLRLARGDISVIESPEIDMSEFDMSEFDPTAPLGPDGTPVGPIVDVADGIAVTNDGWIILDGTTMLDEANSLIFGDGYSLDETVMVLPTERGEYRLIGSVLFTPDGAYFDLDALRTQAATSITTTTIVPPTTTLAVEMTGTTSPDELTNGDGQ